MKLKVIKNWQVQGNPQAGDHSVSDLQHLGEEVWLEQGVTVPTADPELGTYWKQLNPGLKWNFYQFDLE